jgi:hypothetical protein
VKWYLYVYLPGFGEMDVGKEKVESMGIARAEW